MLSISTIVRVDVNVQRYAAQPTFFDTGLLLVKDSSFAASKRLKSYANSSEAAAGLIEDGFADSSEAYDNQPEADRAAHRAVPIQAALTLARSLESVVITVNVRV